MEVLPETVFVLLHLRCQVFQLGLEFLASRGLQKTLGTKRLKLEGERLMIQPLSREYLFRVLLKTLLDVFRIVTEPMTASNSGLLPFFDDFYVERRDLSEVQLNLRAISLTIILFQEYQVIREEYLNLFGSQLSLEHHAILIDILNAA